MASFKRTGKDHERGVSSIEYGLLAALIAVAALVGFTALGNANEGKWGDWVGKVTTAIKGG